MSQFLNYVEICVKNQYKLNYDLGLNCDLVFGFDLNKNMNLDLVFDLAIYLASTLTIPFVSDP